MITLRNLIEDDALELQKKKYKNKTISEIEEKIQGMNSKYTMRSILKCLLL